MPSNLQHPRGACCFGAFNGEHGSVQSGVSLSGLRGLMGDNKRLL